MAVAEAVERADVAREPDSDKRFPRGWDGKERRSATIAWNIRETECGTERVELHVYDYADSRKFAALVSNVLVRPDGGMLSAPMSNELVMREQRARYSRKAFEQFIERALANFRAEAAAGNLDAFLEGEHICERPRAIEHPLPDERP